MAKLGEALTGRAVNIEDRRDTQWPEYDLPNQPKFLPQSPTPKEEDTLTNQLLDLLDPSRTIPPATRLGIDAGIHDIGPLSKEEILKFMIGTPDVQDAAGGPLKQGGSRIEPLKKK